jgi:hypothetical protein
VSNLLQAQTLVVMIERYEKCWTREHRHEPFVCEKCGGRFCRFAESVDEGIDGAEENICLECWEDPGGEPPDDDEPEAVR